MSEARVGTNETTAHVDKLSLSCIKYKYDQVCLLWAQ